MDGLSFWYDVAGAYDPEVSLNSTTYQDGAFTNYKKYIPTDAGLTFWYSIAGSSLVTADLHSSSYQELSRRITVLKSADIRSASRIEMSKAFRFIRAFDQYSATSLEPEMILNAGYQAIIQFGSIVMKNAKQTGQTEYNFPCAAKRLLDGSQSIHVRQNLAFVGKFWAYTDDWNEIQALMNLVGTPSTLRVYGRPYRNCMIWSPMIVKQIKDQFNRWYYEIEFYQDTALTMIST